MVVSKASLLRALARYAPTGDTTTTTPIPWTGWSSAARLFLGVRAPASVPAGSRLGLLVSTEAFKAMEEGSWDGLRVSKGEERFSNTLSSGDSRRHIAILDFNPRIVRRASGASVDSGTSVIRTVQAATTVVAPEMFLTPVESSLPFQVSCCKEPVDYEDVQLDFENLVGFTKSGQVGSRTITRYDTVAEVETLEPNTH
jgi:hypothetical protein